ncbi:TUL4 family lipoprotein [Facilibium subflavum]|uniref:TUL4 family lipoprotein n=1 Tax=Facilibium subflavum TaxID=2219058 RepID=UPI000E659A58|nr:TUL4 family lipoprotein [Facilibium subflavum]
MKKIIMLTAISSAVLLSACASNQNTNKPPEGNFHDWYQNMHNNKDQAKDNTKAQVTPQKAQKPVTSSQMTTTTQDNNIPQSEVKLSVKDDRLIAKLYTNWNSAKQGTLQLHWIAPPNSQCISTTFPIMKYKENRDYSWAYRTLDHNAKGLNVSCAGLWQVEVIYKPTKQIVGSASLNVPKDFNK